MSQRALVTGASSGIGFQIARQLADRGYDIVGVGASNRILGLGNKLPGATVHPVSIDLATDDGVDKLWAYVESMGRPLDIAVLNAGVSLGGGFVDTPIDAERQMIALNITSQVLLAKRVVAAMTARRQGRILITSSLSATTPTPYESIYGPTRAFMYSFAQGLHEELREYGVTVTALLPGATATKISRTSWHGCNEVRVRRLEKRSRARGAQRCDGAVRRQGPRHRWRPQDPLDRH